MAPTTYYVQTDEVGDWIEGYTVWGSDGSRSRCDTFDEVERLTTGQWYWLSLEDALVHHTREPLPNEKPVVRAEFWDHQTDRHQKADIVLGDLAPWYRPLSLV